jgi:hypothetical protein
MLNKTGILSGSLLRGGQQAPVAGGGILVFLLDELAGIRHLFQT